MRKLLALSRNDIRMQFMERSELVFFLVLPILFTSILAVAMGNANSGGDSRYVVMIVDLDQSALAERLVTAMQTSRVIRPIVTSQSDAEQRFTAKNAGIPAIVTIPAGFSQSLVNGQTAKLKVQRAPSDSRVLAVEQEISSLAGQISSAALVGLASVAEAEAVRPFASTAARQAYADQAVTMAQEQLKSTAARVVATQARSTQQDEMSSQEQASAGQMVTWALITFIGAAAVFVDERLGGTLRRLASTPTRRSTILSGKIIGRLATGLLQMAILIGFGALIFKVDWGQSPAALVAACLSFGLAAVAFGVMLATFAKTRSQAGWLVIMFSMLMAALGGCWWPLEITPPVYQTVVKILPTTWAMEAFNNILVRGAGLEVVMPQVAVLLLFAVAYFTIGVRRFRFE